MPFTRAGCDVGAFSVANIEFESVPADVQHRLRRRLAARTRRVNAALAAPEHNNFANQPARQSPNTDWLGIAIHCAQGSPLCSGPNGAARPLPDEPGGYTGFNALFGNVNVAPVICATAPIRRPAT